MSSSSTSSANVSNADTEFGSTTLYHPVATDAPAHESKDYRMMVGVGVIVRRGPEVLIGRRINSHGHGTWAVPGGRVEAGETFIATAVRELKEETGITLDATIPEIPYTFPPSSTSPSVNIPRHNIFEQSTMAVLCPRERVHMIVSYVVVDCPEGAVAILTEPDKCAGWHWVPWTDVVAIAHYHEQLMRGVCVSRPPSLSAACPLDAGTDVLFAPLHALAISGYVPERATPPPICI